MKKLVPNHKYTIIIFLIIFLLLEFVLWGLFGTKWWNLDGKPYVSNGMVNDIIITSISIIISVVGFIIYYIKTKYIIDEKSIKIPGRKKEYSFKDITYLDEEYSNKNIDLKIYVEGQGLVSLTMDKKKELLKIIKEKGNLMDEIKFKLKHPSVEI